MNKKSVDARSKPDLFYIYEVDVEVFNEDIILNKNKYNNDYCIYLSYDIDINDPSFAPGTGTPEAFGPTSRMVLELILGLFNNLNIKAFDIVEVSPVLDSNDITSWLALKTLYEVFNILQRKNG